MGGVLDVPGNAPGSGFPSGSSVWSGFCIRARDSQGGSRVQTSAVVRQLRPRAAEEERVSDDALVELVERIKEGDALAFDELYRLTRNDVARTLTHLVGRRSDLEDLIQETYLRLLKAVKGFRGESRFRTFLYRVCANTAFMHLRWWRRRPEEPVAELPERVSTSDPEGEAAQAQARRLIELALQKLKPKKRAVFVYHELMGLGPEEIGQIVGTSPNTVRSRLHHARLEFHAAMQVLLKARNGGAHEVP